MKSKKWVVNPNVTVQEKDKFPEVNPVVLQLLFDRGLKTQAEIEEFLYPDYLQDVHDPFLFRNMRKVCERIEKAIAGREWIMIFGDYDTDGVCASLILVQTIKALGGKAKVYLPNREKEGYGLSKTALDYIAKQGTTLVITTDCGISNPAEVAHARHLGMDVIVTDHHEPQKELPQCLTIHPKVLGETYPYKNLAGGGVAFKLAQGLLRCLGPKYPDKDWLAFEKWLLDLAAASTVADMMPLLGENRTLVKYGLVVLNKGRRVGMRHLFRVCGLWDEKSSKPANLTTYHISFCIAPRINAAGRMDHANGAYELLLTENEKEAQALAEELNFNNIKRQQAVDVMTKEALEQVGEVKPDEVRALWAYKPDWPVGLLGLAAGKIAQEHHLPAVAAADLEGKIVASIRSIEGFSIMEAMTASKEYFEKFGGHAMAGGFTLKDKNQWRELQEAWDRYVKQNLTPDRAAPHLSIDLEIPLADVTWDLMKDLEKLEPFGQANPKPVFLTRNLNVYAVEAIGVKKDHLKLSLFDGDKTIRPAIAFGMGRFYQKFAVGSRVDAVYEVDIHEWNGSRELQLKIVDLKACE